MASPAHTADYGYGFADVQSAFSYCVLRTYTFLFALGYRLKLCCRLAYAAIIFQPMSYTYVLIFQVNISLIQMNGKKKNDYYCFLNIIIIRVSTSKGVIPMHASRDARPTRHDLI